MSTDERTLDWLTLSLTPGLGPAGCRLLVERFGSPRQVLAASSGELEQIAGLPKKARAAIGNDEWAQAAAAILQRVRNNGQTILHWDDPAYPSLLRTIHDPPVLLYVKGTVTALAAPGIAVVGARAASTYGLQMARRFAGDLARRGLTIISGMALGIDSAAHRGALNAGGQTLGVLGCGLDIVYPPQNRGLFDETVANGALLSEYPPGTPPDGFRFPARNRIISGLSLGIIVVEAARRSGSLITAHLALEQGREIFAIPGRIDSGKSEGAHRLLKDGAKLVHSVDDIMEELPPAVSRSAATPPEAGSTTPDPTTDLDATSRAVLSALDVYPQDIDTIIAATALPTGQVNEKLLLLELQGLVETLPGGMYRRKNEL